MTHSTLTSLRAVLRSAAAALGVERAAHEALIAEMWSEVVGLDAAAHARPVGLRGTTLLVEVDPGLWVQELSARRGRFMDEINNRLGGSVLAEIRLRPGRKAPEPPAAHLPQVSVRGSELTEQEMRAIDEIVAEIADPELREATRRAMYSQRRWQKRLPDGSPGSTS